jgi:hypothetical protein
LENSWGTWSDISFDFLTAISPERGGGLGFYRGINRPVNVYNGLFDVYLLEFFFNRVPAQFDGVMGGFLLDVFRAIGEVGGCFGCVIKMGGTA